MSTIVKSTKIDDWNIDTPQVNGTDSVSWKYRKHAGNLKANAQRELGHYSKLADRREAGRASSAGDKRVVKNVAGGEGSGLGAALVTAQHKNSMKDVTDKFGRVLGKEVNARLKTDWSEPEFCGPQR